MLADMAWRARNVSIVKSKGEFTMVNFYHVEIPYRKQTANAELPIYLVDQTTLKSTEIWRAAAWNLKTPSDS